MNKILFFLLLVFSFVFVSANVQAASLEASSQVINVGDSVTCTYVDAPSYSYNYAFYWYKNNEINSFAGPFVDYSDPMLDPQSTINSGFSANDIIKCRVYSRETGNLLDVLPYHIQVLGGIAPSGSVRITPAEPYNLDDLTATLSEGALYSYDYKFEWYKNDQLFTTIQGSNVQTDANGDYFTVIDDSLTTKHDIWKVRVFDSQGIEVDLTSVRILNSNPVISPISNIVVNANTNILVDVDATDADNDALNYALYGTIPSGMTINPNTGLINWTPSSLQAGTHTINVRVADFDNGLAVQTFTITVNPVTDNFPVVNLESPLNGDNFAVSTITFNYNTTDDFGIGSSELLIDDSVVDTDTTVSMGITQSFMRTIADGIHTWQVCVNDTANQRTCSEIRTFNVNTTVPDTEAPVISNVNVAVTNESATVSWTTNEISNSSVNYGLTTILENSISDVNYALTHSISLQNLVPGTLYYFTSSSCDPSGNCATTSIANFTTLTNVINQPPVLAAIGNKVVNEGVRLNFTVSATDPENDPLTFYASNLPGGATFINRMFDWTPSFTQSGIYLVTFNVTDGMNWDMETIQITVNDVNVSNNPYFNSTPVKTAKIGDSYVYDADAVDPAGGSITYQLVEYPTGMKINKYTGLIEWEPTEEGDFDVRIQARSSATGLVAYQEYEIEVAEGTISNNDLFIKRVQILNEEVSANDVMDVMVTVKNNANARLDDLKVTVSIDELGIKTTSGMFDLKYGEEATKTLHLQIPKEVQEKDYDVRVVVSNDKVHRVVYRVVHINGETGFETVSGFAVSEDAFDIVVLKTTPTVNMLTNNPQGLNWLAILLMLLSSLLITGLIFFLIWKKKEEEQKQAQSEVFTNF